MLLAWGMSGLLVGPMGSKRMPRKRAMASGRVRPSWMLRLKARQKAWHMPHIVEPSLAILMKISPGRPSG